MANLSLREVAQSQLDQAPVIDGQLIVCTDTGSTYRDIGTRRIQISKDLEIVSSLPLAPLSNKIYYLRPDSLYVYSGDDWILLNPSKFTLEADKNAVNGEVNINLILNGTAQDKIKIAGGGVTTVTTGETGDITIDTPHPDELLAALTNDEIDAITGGMVDDSGNPLPTPQVVVDATLTVSGRAADAKVTGTRISEALSIAKSADTGLTNVRTELDKLKLDSVAVDKTLTKENFAADAKAVGDALAKKANTEHNHDDRYYTEDEINVKLSKKSDDSHTHDERYYQQNEIDEKFKSIKTDWNSVTDKPETFPPSAHNHSAANITSGILGLARGGTGCSTALDSCNALLKRGGVPKNQNWNDLTTGVWTVAPESFGSNSPSGIYTYGAVIVFNIDGSCTQVYVAHNTGAMMFRQRFSSSNSFSGWALVNTGSTLSAYPVGAIYMSTSSTSPASLFGGSWTQIQNQFLLAAGSGYSAGSTGGSTTHSHSYGIRYNSFYATFVGDDTTAIRTLTYSGTSETGYKDSIWVQDVSTKRNSGLSSGSTSTSSASYLNRATTSGNSNMPPYLAVYVWKRTA